MIERLLNRLLKHIDGFLMGTIVMTLLLGLSCSTAPRGRVQGA